MAGRPASSRREILLRPRWNLSRAHRVRLRGVALPVVRGESIAVPQISLSNHLRWLLQRQREICPPRSISRDPVRRLEPTCRTNVGAVRPVLKTRERFPLTIPRRTCAFGFPRFLPRESPRISPRPKQSLKVAGELSVGNDTPGNGLDIHRYRVFRRSDGYRDHSAGPNIAPRSQFSLACNVHALLLNEDCHVCCCCRRRRCMWLFRRESHTRRGRRRMRNSRGESEGDSEHCLRIDNVRDKFVLKPVRATDDFQRRG
jgi:hypothetical protein